jgi:DNA-binding transcriptional ArsR family regulator
MAKKEQSITEPDVVRALAHPLRVRLLNILDQRTASPRELATELGQPLGNVSYHVRVLASLGMVKLVSRKQRRGAIEHFYRAVTRPVITEQGWGRLPEIVKSAMVGANLASTGEYVQAALEQGGFSRKDIHLTRTTAEVDERAWRQLAEVLEGTFKRVREIVDEAGERLSADPHAERQLATAVLMLFEGGDPRATPAEPQSTRSGASKASRQ